MASRRPPELGDSIERVMAGWAASRPDLDVSPIAVTARIFRLSAELQPRLDAPLARYGLRSADFAVLATLVRLGEPRVTQSTLGRELGLTAGTISFRIDRLEREGFVTREQGREDRRQALVAITRRGVEAFDACVGEHLRNSQDVLAGLEPEESELLGSLLGRLLRSLEDPGPDDVLAAQAGIVVAPAAVALRLRREVGLPAKPGVLVRHVDPHGPAAAAGLRPGDLLTAVDSRALRTAFDLRAALTSSRAKSCALDVVRGTQELRCRLPALPEAAPSRAVTAGRG